MLPRYIREMRRCNINASHEIFVAILPFTSLAFCTLYRRTRATAKEGKGRKYRKEKEGGRGLWRISVKCGRERGREK